MVNQRERRGRNGRGRGRGLDEENEASINQNQKSEWWEQYITTPSVGFRYVSTCSFNYNYDTASGGPEDGK